MDLYIYEPNFNPNNITLKYRKNCIKLIYVSDFIKVIGVYLLLTDIHYEEINGFYIIQVRDKEQLEVIKMIDYHLEGMFKNYESCLRGDKIKVKINESGNKPCIGININNIKNIHGNYKLQIFST
jgi:hypothetical protein